MNDIRNFLKNDFSSNKLLNQQELRQIVGRLRKKFSGANPAKREIDIVLRNMGCGTQDLLNTDLLGEEDAKFIQALLGESDNRDC